MTLLGAGWEQGWKSQRSFGGEGHAGHDSCPFSPPRLRVCSSSLPYFHKCPQVRMLLLALFCVGVSVVWAVFRNEDQ